jgi:hypothetical protein
MVGHRHLLPGLVRAWRATGKDRFVRAHPHHLTARTLYQAGSALLVGHFATLRFISFGAEGLPPPMAWMARCLPDERGDRRGQIRLGDYAWFRTFARCSRREIETPDHVWVRGSIWNANTFFVAPDLIRGPPQRLRVPKSATRQSVLA